MSVPKKRPQPGPGAPLTAEREQYRRLMAQGLNNHQACLQICNLSNYMAHFVRII